MFRRWLRDHPRTFGVATFVLMFILGLMMFGDARAGLIGGAYGAALVLLAWRRGGFGWKLEAAESRRIEQGVPAVRTQWLKRATLWVIGITAAVGIALVIAC